MKTYRRLFRLLLTGIIICSASALSAQQNKQIEDAVNKYLSETLDYRHQIHQNPELGNREVKTAKLVADHLRKLGMQVQTGIAHTGVVAVLKGGKPGTVVAVRADMDALPVTEDTDLPFKSTVRTMYLGKDVGVMHACGHDTHTAVQMGVASVLASLKDELPGSVKFIFQPAEEGAPPGEEGGAALMFKEGVLQNPRPSAIFGLHSLSSMDVGKIGYTVGPALAAVDQFIIKLRGQQAHGASPHLSIDPIVTASQVVLALQTIRSRTLSPLEPSVVTVGMFRSGERFNIIPAEVHLEGTVRTYNPDVRDMVEKRMGEILDGITKAAGATYELNYMRFTPATINNPELTRKMLPSIYSVVGENNVIELPPTMGGEDFAVFANDVPGFFYRLGSSHPDNPSGGHHTPTFRADDGCIAVGMKVMSKILIDYLNANSN